MQLSMERPDSTVCQQQAMETATFRSHTCSGVRLVTSVTMTVLSRGHPLRRAVVCMTAVRKLWGLKSPAYALSLVTAALSSWRRTSPGAQIADAAL